MFERASRLKLRFETPRGLLTVEDLWDLPLQTSRQNGVSLDQIAIDLNNQIKDATTVSFVEETTRSNEVLALKFDIVKHVIAEIKAENAARHTAAERLDRKQRLLELIAKKQDAALSEKSVEELTAMVDSL
jgi:hypothetical protein